MSTSLQQRLQAIPGVHVHDQGGTLVVEPVTEHDLIQTLVALRLPESKVRLSLARMARIGNFNEASLTVSVDPGVQMAELEVAANQVGMTLGALSPGAKALCVGEFLEGAYGGMRAVPGGRLEPVSMALRVVTPDALATASHHSPRSAAGPELDALYLGGGRRFGVISQATMRLFPKASTSQRACFSFAAAPSLVRALIATLQDGVVFSHGVLEKRSARYVATMQIQGTAESIERDLQTFGHRATDAQGRGAAFGADPVALAAAPEHALDWRELRAALEAGSSLEVFRIAVDGVVAIGTDFGRKLDPAGFWPSFAGIEELSKTMDRYGVMRILS